MINYNKAKTNVLQVKIFDKSMIDEWDDFVENKAINSTMLHTRKFYNHNPLNEVSDHSFLFYKRKKLVAVISCIIRGDNNKRVLDSHFRATYGGFVFSDEIGIKEAVEIVNLLVVEAKKREIKEIVIRNPFKIIFKEHNEVFDYALWFNGFVIKHRELEIGIPIHDIATMRSRYSEGARSGVNKANKTLTIGEDDEIELFWKLLEKNLKVKYKAKPTHTYEQFSHLIKNVGSDKIKLFTARHEGEMIAGVVIFILNDRCLHAQYIAHDLGRQSLRPINAIIDCILRWGHKKHFTYFNLGRANEDNGKVINFTLFKFKESYGGVGVLRETMHLVL